ncbi:MAG: DNA primase [Bacillota bacterium]|nr:DNA primase [Bacillota bacterium]MDW7676270.1 DNA primase [Bacillota bacterium]
MKKRIPDDIVNEIISRNDIVEVISEYLPLQPGGANHSALCPFHNEKTPSFMVSREKQIFKCFGCGAAGNVVGFIMEKENLDFVEALKKLAERVHMQIPEEDMTPEARQQLQEQHQMMDLHREAAAFYFKCLKKKGNMGAAYLAKRGWSIQTIKSFGLGYAPDQWDALSRHLLKRGYTEEQAVKSGLAIKKKESGSVYDRFRNRVMFPIFDIRGNVVAFGGRILTPEGTPKYLNSPETPTFNKRHLLYGLNIARTHLQQNTLILVEGYTDVISLHERGFRNSAATLGTSLTPDHARLVEKIADRVILCFDGDEAGLRAAQRSIQIFRQTKLEVRILTLPKGTDPDQYVHEKGAESFQQLLQQSPAAVDYQISLIRRKHSLATVEGKLHFARETAEILKQIDSLVEREAYAGRISEEIGVSKTSFMQELQNSGRFEAQTRQVRRERYPLGRASGIEAMIPLKAEPLVAVERQFLKWMLVHPDEIRKLEDRVTDDLFQDPAHKIIFQTILENSEELILNRKKFDLFAGFEKELANIEEIEDHDLPLEEMVKRFTRFIKIYRLKKQLKHLEMLQNRLTENRELNPKEKEDEMLTMGMEIRRINIELQQLSLQKGGITNG